MNREQRKKYNDTYYEKNRERILEKFQEEYHSENSKLKKYWQDYYDKNRDYQLKKAAKKTREMTFEEREKRRIYQAKYYQEVRREYYHNILKERNKLLKYLDFVKIEEGKYIVEL